MTINDAKAELISYVYESQYYIEKSNEIRRLNENISKIIKSDNNTEDASIKILIGKKLKKKLF